MAHVGILFCLYDHLKQLKEENIMAYMSEEGYKKLMAELKELETVERPKISAAIAEAMLFCFFHLRTKQSINCWL